MEAAEAKRLFGRIAANIESVMRGQHAAVRKLLAAFAGGGHVLIEDTPGTGKTTLAKALAASVGARFARVQFTPDLLPSDILGVSVFNQREQQFEFRPGPVFTTILLADEVNRASPRTQSALLEVMAEAQVSIEGPGSPPGPSQGRATAQHGCHRGFRAAWLDRSRGSSRMRGWSRCRGPSVAR